MADLAAVTKARVRPVEVIEQITLPAGVAIDAGELVSIDANGRFVLADANPAVTTHGIAITTADVAYQTITAVVKGVVDVGDVLGGIAVKGLVYVSDTAGLMADAQVNGIAAIGEVIPAWGATTVDKLLRIDL